MLHLVNKSPFEKTSLDTCLRLSAAGASILLIEDGVYGGLADSRIAPQVREHMPNKKFFALGPDLQARGISAARLLAGIEVVDYAGFVRLAASASKTQSWL